MLTASSLFIPCTLFCSLTFHYLALIGETLFLVFCSSLVKKSLSKFIISELSYLCLTHLTDVLVELSRVVRDILTLTVKDSIISLPKPLDLLD